MWDAVQRKELIAWDMECKNQFNLTYFSSDIVFNNSTALIFALVVVRAIAFTPDGSTMAVGFGGKILELIFDNVLTLQLVLDVVCMFL